MSTSNGRVVGDELTWTIGDAEIFRVEENILTLPTKVLLPDTTQDQIDHHKNWVAPYFDAPGDAGPVMRLSIHSFVVRSQGRTIVVDTCVGPDPERSLEGDPAFIDRLDTTLTARSAAVPEGDNGLSTVDVVVCTHLHFDHVGWNTVTVDGVVTPTFPNARYLITRAEMEELDADDHMQVRDPSVQPLLDADVVDVIDVDADAGYRITDEVRLISTPGHTAGHVSVLIESGDSTALITGDAFHSPIQFAHPELAAWRFDTDSDQSTATRRSMIDRFLGTDTVLLGTHFAPPTAGVLRRDGDWVTFAKQGAD